jgi:hypothetical protein
MRNSPVELLSKMTPPPDRPGLNAAGLPLAQDRARLLYLAAYLRMRLVIGAFALSLPLLLWAVESALSDRVNPSEDLPGSLRGSMSASYHSSARDLFVASLVVIGVFLLVYRVSQRRLENRTTTAAGFLVIVVALLPTKIPDKPVNSLCPGTPLPPDAYPDCSFPTGLQDKFEQTQFWHLLAAVLFFVLMAVMSFAFAAQEARRDSRRGCSTSEAVQAENRKWSRIHSILGWTILAGGGWFALKGLLPDDNWWDQHAMLFAEWQGVWAFGLSWLLKGAEWDYLRAARRAAYSRQPAAAAGRAPDDPIDVA